MELRTTEQEANDMLTIYESLRRQGTAVAEEDRSALLPRLELPEKHPALSLLQSDEYQTKPFDGGEAEILQSLESLRQKCIELTPKMKKFSKRLAEKDPVTEAPRYGAKTAERVTHLLALYKALQQSVWSVFGLMLDAEDDEQHKNTVPENPNSFVSKLRGKVAEQEQAAKKSELEARRQKEEEEKRQKAEEQIRQQEEEEKQRQEEERRRAEDAEIRRRAEEVRQAQRRAEEEAAQAERDWINSIEKGPEGVRKQLAILKEATANDPTAQKTALSALLQIFTQIAKHPEEISHRRIRRDHPKFNEDIGRHPGGKELLIAAGFALTTLDDVPCYYSKEPDLESDMDGWSAWFDNLKDTLEVVKEMQ